MHQPSRRGPWDATARVRAIAIAVFGALWILMVGVYMIGPDHNFPLWAYFLSYLIPPASLVGLWLVWRDSGPQT
jgi:hypothetical protein